jgi:DNA-binding transcriptional LysR family regulator
MVSRDLAHLEGGLGVVLLLRTTRQLSVTLVLPTFTVTYGLAEALRDLLGLHPELRLQIETTDRAVELVGSGWDIGVIYGPASDSALVVRHLARVGARLAASRDSAERCGLPPHPRELQDHACLRFIDGRPRPSGR